MMIRIVRAAAVLAAIMMTFSGSAGAIEGMRGATWGELRYDIPRDGQENLLLDGWVKQGIDWVKWGDTTLNTYAKIRYRWDSEGYVWNNLAGPAVGVSLDMYVPAGLSVSVGFEYMWESRFEDDRDAFDHLAIAYINWYGWWDLGR